MDKNTITGLVLIAVVLIGFSYFNQPATPPVEEATEQAAAHAEQPQQQQPAATLAQQPAALDSTDLFYCSTLAEEADVVLQNEKMRVVISSKSGMVSEVQLKEFRNYNDFQAHRDSATLLLYNKEDAALSLTLEAKERNIDLSRYTFTATALSDSAATLTLASADGQRAIVLDYRLPTESYLLQFDLSTRGMADLLPAKGAPLQIEWHDRVAQHEKGYYFENMYSTLTYKLNGDDTEKLAENGNEQETAKGQVDWVAFKNQYFSAVLLAAEPMQNATFESQQEEEGSGYLKHYAAQLATTLAHPDRESAKFQFYFGPNNYRLLQSVSEHTVCRTDAQLQSLVYLGWPIVKWINRFFTLYVFDFLTRLGLPMGLVLLLITLLLRVIVYVPTRKSFLSSAKMRVLRPKVDEIAKKYPNEADAMKRQQETMSLYSQYGVSPMGGCLPMLIQMPIWIAMFNFVPNAIELRQQSFLWAEDLSTYDSLISWNTSIWGLGNHLSLFCILFCVCNLLYSWMSMRQQRESMSGEQAAQMKMMQWMMLLMPLFFFFMFNKYSAGLNYYYFISLLLSAATMWYLRRTTNDAKLLKQLEANYEANKNNPNRKASGLAARLEALQKQQEELARRQKK